MRGGTKSTLFELRKVRGGSYSLNMVDNAGGDIPLIPLYASIQHRFVRDTSNQGIPVQSCSD